MTAAIRPFPIDVTEETLTTTVRAEAGQGEVLKGPNLEGKLGQCGGDGE